MAEFGPGQHLAAQCPTLSIPSGWRPWATSDGPIPAALLTRSAALAADQTVPLGVTESYPLPGVVALIRVEPQTWSRDAQGHLAVGCFRIGGIYLPAVEPIKPTIGRTEKLIGGLTIVSLGVGIVATVASLRRKK